MIVNLIVTVIFDLFDALTNAVFFGQSVTELPFGLQEPMETFISGISSITYYMPWMQVIWEVFVLALTVKVAMFIYKQVLFFIQLARG